MYVARLPFTVFVNVIGTNIDGTALITGDHENIEFVAKIDHLLQIRLTSHLGVFLAFVRHDADECDRDL
jgi:hypothetical protein